MRQLTSLDTQFLALENGRQTGHVGGLAIYDPSTAPGGRFGAAELRALVKARLPHLPPLRWKLTEVPFGLDYPYWVDDEAFDLDFHVRELALPRPGSDRQLAQQAARIHSRALDRSRPLWELYAIHGLPEGRVAVLSKIHHAVIDGVSGAEIMGLLFDVTPEVRELPAPEAAQNGDERVPSSLELAGRGLLGLPKYPLRALKALPSAVPNLGETAFAALPGARTVGQVTGTAMRALGSGELPTTLGPKRLKAPATSFNTRISPHRRFAFGSLDLADVKRIKGEHGTTVNDVVVSLCAGAVRRWLVAHDELPDEPLVAQVPVSVRTDEQTGTYGNRILLMHAPLLTNVEDPVERLRATHEALREMKDRRGATPATLLQDANHFIPPAVFARAAQLSLRLGASTGRPAWNLVVSNVPGPQFPLYCAGAKMLHNYPVSVITDGMGLNITVMSYMGRLDFGLLADRDQMPDVWDVMDGLGAELEALRT